MGNILTVVDEDGHTIRTSFEVKSVRKINYTLKIFIILLSLCIKSKNHRYK
jgi:hypothetical protein